MTLDRRKLLIGEGIDEINFFEALLETMGILDVQVLQSGGKTKIAKFLKTISKLPDFWSVTAVRVTRDVDDQDNEGDPADVLRSVRHALEKAGLAVPTAAESTEPSSPRVGIFLMPGSGRTGALENLCLDAIAEDPASRCIDAYFSCLADVGMVHAAKDLAKARVHAWLASRATPDRRLGEAAKAREWPFDNPAFDPLKRFRRELFTDPTT